MVPRPSKAGSCILFVLLCWAACGALAQPAQKAASDRHLSRTGARGPAHRRLLNSSSPAVSVNASSDTLKKPAAAAGNSTVAHSGSNVTAGNNASSNAKPQPTTKRDSQQAPTSQQPPVPAVADSHGPRLAAAPAELHSTPHHADKQPATSAVQGQAANSAKDPVAPVAQPGSGASHSEAPSPSPSSAQDQHQAEVQVSDAAAIAEDDEAVPASDSTDETATAATEESDSAEDADAEEAEDAEAAGADADAASTDEDAEYEGELEAEVEAGVEDDSTDAATTLSATESSTQTTVSVAGLEEQQELQTQDTQPAAEQSGSKPLPAASNAAAEAFVSTAASYRSSGTPESAKKASPYSFLFEDKADEDYDAVSEWFRQNKIKPKAANKPHYHAAPTARKQRYERRARPMRDTDSSDRSSRSSRDPSDMRDGSEPPLSKTAKGAVSIVGDEKWRLINIEKEEDIKWLKAGVREYNNNHKKPVFVLAWVP